MTCVQARRLQSKLNQPDIKVLPAPVWQAFDDIAACQPASLHRYICSWAMMKRGHSNDAPGAQPDAAVGLRTTRSLVNSFTSPAEPGSIVEGSSCGDESRWVSHATIVGPIDDHGDDGGSDGALCNGNGMSLDSHSASSSLSVHALLASHCGGPALHKHMTSTFDQLRDAAMTPATACPQSCSCSSLEVARPAEST